MDKKNGGAETKDEKTERESIAELAARLGLRDAEGKLDLEAAKRVVDSEVEAEANKAKAAKAAEVEAKAEAKKPEPEPVGKK